MSQIEEKQTSPDAAKKKVKPKPVLEMTPGGLKISLAGQYLGGLSKPTMHRLVKRGLLKPNRATRHLIFPIAELDRFLRQ